MKNGVFWVVSNRRTLRRNISSQLTDGGEFVSLTNRQRSTPQEHVLFLSLVLIPVRG
jgi:hypothetical protein